jgi:CheY-like chemotaxis protein
MVSKPLYHHAASSAPHEFDGRKLILSVAVDEGVLLSRCRLLTFASYAVLSASDAGQALELFGSWRPQLAVVNYELSNVKGDVVAEAIKSHTPRTPVIMVVPSIQAVGQCVRNVDRFLFSADGADKLLRTIRHLLEFSG